jgi:hypothetical protein
MSKYGDILKSVADIFKKDFAKKDEAPVTFEINVDGPHSTSFTSTSTFDMKEGSKLGNTVSAAWSHPSGFALDKLEFDPSDSGSITTETSLVGLYKGLKLEFKGNDNDKADLSFTYKNPALVLTGSADIMGFKKFNCAAAKEVAPNVTVGVDSSITTGKKSGIAFNVAGSYTVPKSLFAGFEATKNFSAVTFLASYAADKDITAAAKIDYSLDKGNMTAAMGAVYKCNANTTMKVKADMNKVIDFSVKQNLDKNLVVTGFTQVKDFSYSSMVFGLKAVLG